MQLLGYFPVDLTGNLIMIEKLVLDEILFIYLFIYLTPHKTYNVTNIVCK